MTTKPYAVPTVGERPAMCDCEHCRKLRQRSRLGPMLLAVYAVIVAFLACLIGVGCGVFSRVF